MANRALLVGINSYPTAPLNGCVNDISDMCDFLTKSCGFAEAEIRVLVDDRATTDQIRARLNWLASDVQPNDRRLFQYSGHGTQLVTRDANGNVTAMHDAICPVDFDFTPEHALTDDDFTAIFQQIPAGVEFNWISDSCNSGDLAKAMTFVKRHPRFFPMPFDLQWRIRTARAANLQPPGLPRSIQHLNGAFMSACMSNESADDATPNGRPNGAFTFCLLQVLGGPTGLTMPLTELVGQVNNVLQQYGYTTQHPQLQGNPVICSRPWLNLAPGA